MIGRAARTAELRAFSLARPNLLWLCNHCRRLIVWHVIQAFLTPTAHDTRGSSRKTKIRENHFDDPLGKCEGSRLVGGSRLVVFPRLLTPYRPKNTTSRDPYPPSSRDPPSRPGPPLAPIWEGGRGKGQGVPAREGVPARGSLELWAVWAWEYHEPGPPNEPGPFVSPDPCPPYTVRTDMITIRSGPGKPNQKKSQFS